MKLDTLTEILNDYREEFGGDAEVRLMTEQNWPLENRITSGQGYEGFKAAFERLAGTRISTNIVSGEKEIFDNFGLIERFTIVRETRDGRMQEIEVKLSDWVFNAICCNEVLTLSRDYFRL